MGGEEEVKSCFNSWKKHQRAERSSDISKEDCGGRYVFEKQTQKDIRFNGCFVFYERVKRIRTMYVNRTRSILCERVHLSPVSEQIQKTARAIPSVLFFSTLSQ